MRPKSAPSVNREDPSSASTEEVMLPVVEEVAYLDKQVVEAGRVRVSKKVTETEQVFDEPMLREEVTVERVPMHQYVDVAPQVRYEGNLMIIPVVEEQYVMQKRLVLVEEIRLRKEHLEIHQPQKIRLRKEKVEVRRVAGEPPPRRRK
jgi:uncharacterized protein (TIGR02271 family)